MKRLKLLLLLFSFALAAPLAYFVLRTHESLEREETAELRFFAETLFNQMEEELALLVQKEESRAVDDYAGAAIPAGLDDFDPLNLATGGAFLGQDYILGYLQSNQDGAMHAALPPWAASSSKQDLPGKTVEDTIGKLGAVGEIFTRKRSSRESSELETAAAMDALVESRPETRRKARPDDELNVADKYLDSARPRKSKTALGQEKKRVVGITPDQAQNLAQKDQAQLRPEQRQASLMEAPTPLLAQAPTLAPQVERTPAGSMAKSEAEKPAASSRTQLYASRPDSRLAKETGATSSGLPTEESKGARSNAAPAQSQVLGGGKAEQDSAAAAPSLPTSSAAPAIPGIGLGIDPASFALEIDPLQSVSIDADTVFIFRRIVLGNAIFRQGFAVQLKAFLEHLGRRYFQGQPMARFTHLALEVRFSGQAGTQTATKYAAGIPHSSDQPRFSLTRQFPRPFSFLQATLSCDDIPRSEARKTLYAMVLGLALVMLAGLGAIYKSTAVVVDLSERRAGFVSSVTHELKTPLTTIRLYIEMLQHGIAATKAQEQEYLRILNTETGRLSRLIHNVLEFSRLERKQRTFDLREGDFEDVLREILDLLREKLKLEGFTLRVERQGDETFAYDREAMIQALINCIDNSVKFGRDDPIKEITVSVQRHGDKVEVAIADTGPGIPRHALGKVFDDFYRVENSLTRKTQGTGIGLSLVKKLAEAMGGAVKATNNTPGQGCTITLTFAATPAPPKA